MNAAADVKPRYRRFADTECKGYSDLLYRLAIAVSDDDTFASLRDWAAHEGIFLSPEGAAATAAYAQLLATGELKTSDRVVIFNTGAGLKYTDVIAGVLGLSATERG